MAEPAGTAGHGDPALFGKFTSHTLIGNGIEHVACARNLGKTGNFNRRGRPCFGDMSALIIYHRADTADCRTGNNNVTLFQRTVLYKNRHDRAAAFIKAGFDDSTLRRTVRIGFEFLHLGKDGEVFQQVFNAHTGLCGNRADDGIAAPLLGNEVILGELLLDALGICPRNVHLVDGNNDRDISCLRMVDAFNRLRHDAVIRCHNENCNIRYHRTAGTHRGECLMARRIQEGDRLAVDLNGIGTDCLRNAAGFSGGYVGIANIVQQGGLAVVYMAHNHNDRGTGDEIFRLILTVVDQALFHRDNNFLFDLAAEFHRHESCGVIINHIGDRGKRAHLHEIFDDFGGRLLHTCSQISDADFIRDLHLELLLPGNFKLETRHLVAFLLAAFGGSRLRIGTLLGFALDLLLVAAAHIGIVGLVAAEVFVLLVVFIDIHCRTAARIDNALLRDLARCVGLVLFLLLCGRILCRLSTRLALLLGRLCLLVCFLICLALRRFCRFLLCAFGGLLRLLFLSGFRSGCCRSFRCRRCNRRDNEDLLQALHLIVLRHIFKDHIQLFVCQNLHVVLGRSKVLCHDR